MPTGTHPIILFDAQCVLCSRNAQFVLRHDRCRHFLLASMQGDVGASLCRRFGLDPANPDTMIVVEGDLIQRDSDAVIAIWAALDWPCRLLALFRVVPRFARDPFYRFVARHRYRLFGRRETCWIPSREDAERVL